MGSTSFSLFTHGVNILHISFSRQTLVLNFVELRLSGALREDMRLLRQILTLDSQDPAYILVCVPVSVLLLLLFILLTCVNTCAYYTVDSLLHYPDTGLHF